ncbi:hypothetical protein C3B79_2286 [Aeromonas hydrophila]|nr:hypothetical protein C3B79_2286 [Aeromonas hydrophila]
MAHRCIPLPMLLLFDFVSSDVDRLHWLLLFLLLTTVNKRKSKSS